MLASNVARRYSLAVAGLLFFHGCGDEYDGPPFEVGGCEIRSAKRISSESTPLGFSAAEVIARGQVGSSRLVYGYKPGSPAVDLEVGISDSDLERVYWVKESDEQWGDFRESCQQALTFPATIAFRSPGGDFDERLKVDLFVTGVDSHSWSKCVPMGKLKGSYRPPDQPDYKPREICIYGGMTDGEAYGSFELVSDHRQDGGMRISFAGWWGVNPYESS